MLEYLKEIGENSSSSADRAIGKMAEAGLILRKGKDIPFPNRVVEQTRVTVQEDPLKVVIQEFKSNSHTPEVLTNFWRTRWNILGERVGVQIPVANCDYKEEEIS